MDQKRQTATYHFGAYALDPALRELRRDGVAHPVEPRAFDLLLYLAEHRDRLVEKDELIEQVWDGRIVSDASLSTCIKLARQAVGDSGRRQDVIRTVPRRGYRFVADIEPRGLEAARNPETTTASRSITPADPAKMAYSLPEKPSIAVLPFDNLTGDPEQDYLGDGLTENIIAVLSTSPDLVVIARNSSFVYKNTPVQVQEVAERFGVRYVLEGSVQRAGDRLRVTAQLIDAVDGQHLWAQRFDRTLSDLFLVQDDITKRILEEIDVKLTLGEGARRMHEIVGNTEGYRLLFQGRANYHKWSPEGLSAAERLWSELHRRLPGSPLGNACMAWIYYQKVRIGVSDNPGEDLQIARQYADRMVENHPDPQFISFGLLALLDIYDRNYESAIANADRAAMLQPGSAESNALAGMAKALSGQLSEGIALLEHSLRLGPVYPTWVPMVLAFEHMGSGDFDKAKAYCEALLSATVDDVRAQPAALRYLAAMAFWEDDENTARDLVSRSLEIDPAAQISKVRWNLSFRQNQEFVERFLAAMRECGLPE